MEIEQIIKDIKELIAEVAVVSVTEVSVNDNFEGDLNIDGVEKAKILNTLAVKYETEFKDIDVHNINTVQELIDIVTDNLGII
ncbi:MAG: phosphopantetheine-binding protein [bacterium]|nr:phosphopantetheine-binding protein [bacterium]